MYVTFVCVFMLACFASSCVHKVGSLSNSCRCRALFACSRATERKAVHLLRPHRAILPRPRCHLKDERKDQASVWQGANFLVDVVRVVQTFGLRTFFILCTTCLILKQERTELLPPACCSAQTYSDETSRKKNTSHVQEAFRARTTGGHLVELLAFLHATIVIGLGTFNVLGTLALAQCTASFALTSLALASLDRLGREKTGRERRRRIRWDTRRSWRNRRNRWYRGKTRWGRRRSRLGALGFALRGGVKLSRLCTKVHRQQGGNEKDNLGEFHGSTQSLLSWSLQAFFMAMPWQLCSRQARDL